MTTQASSGALRKAAAKPSKTKTQKESKATKIESRVTKRADTIKGLDADRFASLEAQKKLADDRLAELTRSKEGVVGSSKELDAALKELQQATAAEENRKQKVVG